MAPRTQERLRTVRHGSPCRLSETCGYTRMSGTVTIEPLATADFPIVAQWLSEPQTNQWLSSDWRGRTVDPTLIGVAVRNRKNRFYLVRCDGQACGLVA